MPAGSRACPRCKSSNRPEARFCDGCGAPVAKAAADEQLSDAELEALRHYIRQQAELARAPAR